MTSTDVEVGEYVGVFVSHWEIARFVVRVGAGPLGRPQVEAWSAHFPSGFELPHPPDDRHSPPRYFQMRVVGRLGPRGRFGHKGLCTREIHVDEVVSWSETTGRDVPRLA